MVKDYDGFNLKFIGNPFGLDINRNWPANWAQEYQQHGAGPFPLSEPETKAVADFITSHPNIGGAMAYHTYAGATLRPSCTKDDKDMSQKDVAAYRAIGAMGTEVTGYPAINTFSDYSGRVPLKGVFMDWAYEHLGIITFSTELWNLSKRAGIDSLYGAEENDDDGLKLLQWNDRELAGEGFTNWQPFEHPQFGKVEIGGWDRKFVVANPPVQFLLGECHKNMLFTFKHCDTLPVLDITSLTATAVSTGVYKIVAVVKNHGFLPTNVSEVAKDIKIAKPVTVAITAGEGTKLLHGQAKVEVGHLEGRLNPPTFYGSRNAVLSKDRKVEWLVSGQPGQKVTVTASSPRAGKIAKEVTL
jgi:hypothetical protein